MIKLLLVASESTPFVKSGGMADVVGSMARYIDRSVFDCRVIIPDYKICREPNGMSERSYADAETVCEFEVHWGTRDVPVKLLGILHDGCQYYLVNCDEFFGNEEIYTNNRASIERFIFFQKAVLVAMPLLGFKPDIICGNDWEGAMLSVLKSGKCFEDCDSSSDGYYASSITALIIHNIFWQGEQSMRIGIENSDALVTVSESYRDEILNGKHVPELSELLLARRESVYAIENGIDYLKFDPANDGYLVENYSSLNAVEVGYMDEDQSSELNGKLFNKLALQSELGLDIGADKFTLCMVSRMVEQKGLDLIEEVLDDIMKVSGAVQLIFLGDGETSYMEMLEKAEAKYPGRIKALNEFDIGRMAHLIYAGSDAYLMPSRFEPCGISQLIAMRYGTVPIVHLTGGLRDTVSEDVGFGFEHYDAGEMLECIRRAERMFREERGEWNVLANNGMKAEHSSEAAVRKYEELFKELVKGNLVNGN